MNRTLFAMLLIGVLVLLTSSTSSTTNTLSQVKNPICTATTWSNGINRNGLFCNAGNVAFFSSSGTVKRTIKLGYMPSPDFKPVDGYAWGKTVYATGSNDEFAGIVAIVSMRSPDYPEEVSRPPHYHEVEFFDRDGRALGKRSIDVPPTAPYRIAKLRGNRFWYPQWTKMPKHEVFVIDEHGKTVNVFKLDEVVEIHRLQPSPNGIYAWAWVSLSKRNADLNYIFFDSRSGKTQSTVIQSRLAPEPSVSSHGLCQVYVGDTHNPETGMLNNPRVVYEYQFPEQEQ